MQNNSRDFRGREDPRGLEKPKCVGLRTKCNPIDDAHPKEIMKESVFGTVVKCARLNIRKTASLDGGIMAVVDSNTNIMVDLNHSTDEFYKVITSAGMEGFCVKKYIELKS